MPFKIRNAFTAMGRVVTPTLFGGVAVEKRFKRVFYSVQAS